MCLALPSRVVELDGDRARVELGGVLKTVSVALVPEAAVGDYLIVHVGYAIGLLDPDEARRTLELFEALALHGTVADAPATAVPAPGPPAPAPSDRSVYPEGTGRHRSATARRRP
ncbi:MAG: HypC/HybG/HupF family hydrogenase formation chaperone [Burkholderiales bacterium]|nr:MAG: HypC/HybG/HupF family hydrogenase formation chaperone [Burkholderiales bacterium]